MTIILKLPAASCG